MELRYRIRHATAKLLVQHSSYIYGIRGAFSNQAGFWALVTGVQVHREKNSCRISLGGFVDY